MKKVLGVVLGCMLLWGLQPIAFGAEKIKIGVVDLQKIQQGSNAFKKLNESYLKKLEPQKLNLEKKQSELMQFEEEIKKQSMMLSLDAKEDKINEFRKKTRNYKYLENELLQQMKESEVEAKRKVLRDISVIMEKLGAKGNYSIILEKGSSGILYNSKMIDITDEVIKEYDLMHE